MADFHSLLLETMIHNTPCIQPQLEAISSECKMRIIS